MKIFSGTRPSGELHIGNYLGAISNWMELQDKNDCIFSVVDYHAITTPYEKEKFHQRNLEMVAWLIACGIDPEKTRLFRQSQVPEHTELAWILSTVLPVSELFRMTQYKEKSTDQSKENISAGLLNYPILMAADILIYDADTIPVGEDQVQHVELARIIARKFNHRYGKIFTEPKTILTKTKRVMSLKDPTKKMSKTGADGIALGDSSVIITQKIMSAVTDTGEAGKISPAVKNLLGLVEAFGEPEKMAEFIQAIENKTIQYVELKRYLAEKIIEKLIPIQKKYQEIMAKPDKIEQTLTNNAQALRKEAQEKIEKVKKEMGF